MTTTKDELLERVNALLPAIAARGQTSEAARKPDENSIRELIGAEIMQTLVPKRFGGHELGLDAISEIARAISSACMSTGWVTAFYIGHNWMLTKFSEKMQNEVFADRPFGLIPIQPSQGISAKAVAGGYEISGRSNFSSGIMNADWVIVTQAGGPGARAFVVPIEDVVVDDVWHMSGMAATGSNDVVVENLFVQEHRTLPTEQLFAGGDSIHDNPLYSIPLLPFIYCEIGGVYCGGLQGATAGFEELMQTKVATWGGDVLNTKQAVHVNLGDAQARNRAVDILRASIVSDTQAIANQGGFNLDQRIDLKSRAGYLTNLCRESVNSLMAHAGTRSFATDVPLQRFFRDMNTLTSHAFIDWDVCRELFGRHRLGLEPNHPLV